MNQVLFASIMETLGNEALGKIINIVDEVKMLVELESGRGGKRPQTSILNILNTARVGTYTGPMQQYPVEHFIQNLIL